MPILVIVLLLSQGHGSFAGLSVANRSIGVMELVVSTGRYVRARSSTSDDDAAVHLEPPDLVDDLE